MSKKPAKPRKKHATHSKPVKIAGSFTDLIRQSVNTKKPAGGWPRAGK